ncbi:PEP-utilizing enzyme [Streptomyces sp. NBC_01546]|uniref:PEP-utilizing enzyme n=1 Tax=Streptomyces sp. NBC_01546 TaxID=2975872 RepID=UPI003870D7FB
MASHAAIVAREYGIPAVMATADATTRLTYGQHVRVRPRTGPPTEPLKRRGRCRHHVRSGGRLPGGRPPGRSDGRFAVRGVEVEVELRDMAVRLAGESVACYLFVFRVSPSASRRLHGRGITFFAYNWQAQPRRLLDLIDGLHSTADVCGAPRAAPTRLRHTLCDSAHRAAGIVRLTATGGGRSLELGPGRGPIPGYGPAFRPRRGRSALGWGRGPLVVPEAVRVVVLGEVGRVGAQCVDRPRLGSPYPIDDVQRETRLVSHGRVVAAPAISGEHSGRALVAVRVGRDPRSLRILWPGPGALAGCCFAGADVRGRPHHGLVPPRRRR